MNREALISRAVIAALGIGLLALAILVANRLVYRLLRPVNALAHTGEESKPADWMHAPTSPGHPSCATSGRR